jgi:hypothetical protein
MAAPQSAQAIIRDVCNRAAAGAAAVGDWECSWPATGVSRPQCGQNSVRSKPSDSKSFPQCSHLIVRIIFAARSSRASLSGKSDFDASKFHSGKLRESCERLAALPCLVAFHLHALLDTVWRHYIIA